MTTATTHIEVPLEDLLPNPYRRIEHYPYVEPKIVALISSYEQTNYWGNIVVRPSPTHKGKYEIAYGHHRLEALRRYLKKLKTKVGVILNDKLTEELMLQMMANENMEHWQSNALVDLETVHAVVLAFAEGKITLAPVSKHQVNDRFAPSFIPGKNASDTPTRYNAHSLANFLGWKTATHVSDKVYTSLTALEYIELGLLKESDFAGLTSNEARHIVEAANARKRAQEEAAAEATERAAQAQRNAEFHREKAAKAEKARIAAEERAAHEQEALAREEQLRKAEAQRAAAKQHEQKLREAEEERQRAAEEAANHKEKARQDFVTVTRHGAEKVRDGTTLVVVQAEAMRAPKLDSLPPLKKSINIFAEKITTEVRNFLAKDGLLHRQIVEIAENAHLMDHGVRELLVKSLLGLSERSKTLAGLIANPASRNHKPQTPLLS